MIPFLKGPALTGDREIATAAAPGSLAKATEQAKRFSIAPVIRGGRDHCINLFSIVINAEEASCEGWEECVGPWSRGSPIQLWSSSPTVSFSSFRVQLLIHVLP